MTRSDVSDSDASGHEHSLDQLARRLAKLDLTELPATDFDVDRLLQKLDLAQTEGIEGQTPPSSSTQQQSSGEVAGTLGEYDLLGQIGHGGAGQVYRARHRMLGREVALKILRDDFLGDETPASVTQARFLREMRVVGRLNSPHIVAAHDARIEEGKMVLVMELIDGETFRQRIQQQGPASVASACDWIKQTSEGLAAAHAQGIIHRDIKPANMMLTQSGQAKILDLGLASLRFAVKSDWQDPADHPSLTSPSTIMGTVDYVSPEQIDDARRADVRSDIYSLGCVFYYLLTGKPPFCQEDYPSDVARLMAHVSLTPKPISDHRDDVPASIADLVAKMLEKSPDARPQTSTDLIDAL